MKWKLSVSILALLASTFCTIRVCAQEAAHSGQICELRSGFVAERSDHELRGLGERSQWRQSHQLVRRLPRWQGERYRSVELDYMTANLPGGTRGPMVDGKAQGLGTIDFWLDNQYLHYEGSFLNSKLDGWGSVRWPDGSHLEGEFKDDAPSGFVRVHGCERIELRRRGQERSSRWPRSPDSARQGGVLRTVPPGQERG